MSAYMLSYKFSTMTMRIMSLNSSSLHEMASIRMNCNFILLMTQKRQCICRFAPSTHFAPTSSRSLRASYFRSEPIDIHLNNLSLIKNANRQSIMQVQPKKWIGGYRISFLAEVLTKLYAFPAANFPRSIRQWYVLYQHQLHHR